MVFDTLQYNTSNNFELEITGSCNSEEYKEKLKHLADNNKKITLHFDFIDNDNLNEAIQSSDIAIFPFNTASSLNSGTVISPLIGTIQDINDNFFYSYDYNNHEEHTNVLLKTILTVFDDYNKNKDILNNKGDLAYSYVDQNNNWELIGKKYSELYNSL